MLADARAARQHRRPPRAAVFDDATELAVRHFQQRRGISVDGTVGRETYAALTGAHWRLGDRVAGPRLRPAARRRRRHRPADPAARARLPRRPAPTACSAGAPPTALRAFQRESGLVADGICGPATLRALRQLGRRVVGGRPQLLRDQVAVADVRPEPARQADRDRPRPRRRRPRRRRRRRPRGRPGLGPRHPPRGPAQRPRRADLARPAARATAARDEQRAAVRQRGRRRPVLSLHVDGSALAPRRTAWRRTTTAPASRARRSASGWPTWCSASSWPAPACSTAASTARPGRCCG